MAPKHESYITDERKQEIRDMLEEKGFETDRFSVKEAEWLDRALKANCEFLVFRRPRRIVFFFSAIGFFAKNSKNGLFFAPYPPHTNIKRRAGKVPTTSAAEAMKNAEPKKTQKKSLRTYAIHSAREFLGEPVGQKHEA